jgi:hypothetical protein
MSPGLDEQSPVPNGRYVETLRITQAEAREVLSQQVETLSDIDGKAMRTVRIALIVFGIVVSATTFPKGIAFLNWITVCGILSLTLSIVCGIVTYEASNPAVGIGPEYLEEARTIPYTEAEWRALLIAGYEEWVTDIERQIKSNARTLLLAQLFLGIGVVLFTIGVSLALSGYVESVVQPIAWVYIW